MRVSGLDHLVLTVRDIELTVAFYERALGMRRIEFGEGRVALQFGEPGRQQKINLHPIDTDIHPRAAHPTAGSADLCFETGEPLAEVMQQVRDCGVEILAGPVSRTGVRGPMTSFYFRDPDQNLIEVCHY